MSSGFSSSECRGCGTSHGVRGGRIVPAGSLSFAQMAPWCRIFLLFVGLVLATGALFAAEVDTDGDGVSDDVERQLGSLPDTKQELVLVATSKDEQYSDEQAKVNAPDILSLEAGHVGGQRLLFKVTFARPPVFVNSTFIVYADLDTNLETGRQDAPEHRGVDVMVVASGTQMSSSSHNAAFGRENTYVAGAAVVGNVLYITLEAALPDKGDKLRLDLQLLSQRKGGRADSTPRKVVEVPRFANRPVPKVPRRGAPDLRPLSDYRYHDNLVKLEKLEDKGLTFEQVAPAKPTEFGRPRPEVPFASVARKPGKAGSVKRQQVEVQLLEEAGVARRSTAISFGFPFSQGAVFDLNNLRVLSPAGQEVAAQFTATSFWPDDSLKWVLVDFQTPLAAKEERKSVVEFGSAVKRPGPSSPLKVSQNDTVLTVVTGPLKVEIDKQRFNLLRSVWHDANKDGKFEDAERVAASAPEGLRLVDEKGKLFTTSARPPESVKLEEQGPQKVVVRATGQYAAADGQTYMRYVTRFALRAGSPRVTVAHTHIDDYLKTEFTDITSLTMPVSPSGLRGVSLFMPRDDGTLTAYEGKTMKLLQLDEKSALLQTDGKEVRSGQTPGLVRCSLQAGTVSVALHDFWQRWPKGLSADGKEVSIDLLPPQPSAQYGADLPHYLMYPCVSGKYRFKWGMSFTERITFDFSGQTTVEELHAEANRPIVPVVPASWCAQTKALGDLSAPVGKQFAEWDNYIKASYNAFVVSRDRSREYGYLNYGDWYGERGRNWGNNEYDTAHGFFMQFARTGNRDYFRLALTAARHQADVDCVHAYPDPFYIGANHLHSVGHTGAWSEQTAHGVWSWPYDYHTMAANGHTWADGMVDAWCLSGDARIMDAALGLGEHIAWAMSPTFNVLGTHERSAGWSLKAIMALYRATYDPVYLEAAKRIASVALREQKFDQGGAWPHVLPKDHAGDHPGAIGNNLFLVGVLLGGLAAYHQETNDPAVRKSLIAGAEWVVKSWNENAEGWPYSATVAGEPLYKPSPGLNPLIIEPLAYVGQLTADEKLINIAETALGAVARGGPESSGKSIAQKMHFTPGTLALLQQWYETHRKDKGVDVLDGSPASVERFLAKTPDAQEHSVRAPDEKVFFVNLRGQASELITNRRPHGAMTKRAEFGTIQVMDAAGAVVKEGRFSTDEKHEFRCPLKGAPGAVFKVVVRDDQRGVWSLGGENLGIVMETVKEFRIGGVGRGKYRFFVPQGTKEFSVRLLGVHPGGYGGAVLSPANKVVGHRQGTNQGQALIPGAARVAVPQPDEHPERGILTIKPAPEDTGKLWSLVLWAAVDLGCELEGVPPYLSLTAEAWFDPTR